MNKISRNIKVDYLYRFFASFDITSGIWVLYLAHKGMSLVQIGFLESIFHITGLISEVPTGVIADLLGRKKAIVFGRVASLISALIMLFSNSFFGFAIGFILSAWGYNLNSGSEEALIYDSLKEINKENEYLKVNGRLNLIIEVAQGLAVFIGGMLSEISFSISYIVAFLVGLCALAIAYNFKETSLIKKREEINIINHFKECIDILRGNSSLLKIMLFFSTIYTFSAIVYFYGQQYFYNMGYSKGNIALIFLINGVFSSLGALISERVEKVFKNKEWIFISILISISIILIGFSKGVISIIIFFIINGLTAILQPISSNKINLMVNSEQRATIISVESMFFSLMMILFFPLSGYIGDKIYLENSFKLIGVISFIIVVIVNVFYNRK
ncbi:MFS transporter [Clostridium carnis]